MFTIAVPCFETRVLCPLSLLFSRFQDRNIVQRGIDKAKEWAGLAKEEAGEAADTVKDKADQVKRKAREARDSGYETLEAGKDKVRISQ